MTTLSVPHDKHELPPFKFKVVVVPHPLLQRLSTFSSKLEKELEGFSLLSGPRRAVSKGAFLRMAGDASPQVYLLRSGWVICSVETPTGARQITKVHLAGDLVGMPSFAGNMAVETVQAATDVEIETIPLEAFGRLFKAYPKSAAMLFVWSQEERARLMHQMTVVGRVDGMPRLAGFLLSLYQRYRLSFEEEATSIPLPLTQSDLADATGMTYVHANRCLKTLREQGIASIHQKQLTIDDYGRLQHLAGIPALPVRSLDWL